MTKQRITMISLIGFLVFGLLLGGQMIYKKNWLDAGLIEKANQISGIESTQVSSVNGENVLHVHTQQVTQLRSMINELEYIAPEMAIKISDSRTPELEKAYEKMQFAIQEGIVRGNFTEMNETLHNHAKTLGVDIEVAMDSRNIYLSLTKGNHQLISVIERHGQGKFIENHLN